jgi:hypothetical protein
VSGWQVSDPVIGGVVDPILDEPERVQRDVGCDPGGLDRDTDHPLR